MKKITRQIRRITKAKKKFNFWLVLVILISIISLGLYLGYRSLAVTPSINLADGLDPEEAAFLQKSISKDKRNTTGAAPAPVVKVTVKDKDTGEEYSGKVLLKNIDKPDNVDVTTLTAAITKTVIENNTPTKPSPVADPASLPPLPPTGQSCSTVAAGQWAQTGIQYQSDGSTVCKTGEACAGLRECAQCKDGAYDLANKQVCGQGQAVIYLTRPEEGKNAPCWEGGVQYADSSSFAGRGKCQNGKWVDIPAPIATPISDELEQAEQDFLIEARRKDENPITPVTSAVGNPTTQTPNIPDPQSPDDRSSVNAPALANDTIYYSSRINCEQGIDKTQEQCDILPGGGYGRVPLVVVEERPFNPFNFGSANSGGTPTTLVVGESCTNGFFGIGGTCSQCPGGESHVEKTAAFQARRVCGEEIPPTTPQIASNNDTTDESTPSCSLLNQSGCGEGSTCEFNWAGFNSKWECVSKAVTDTGRGIFGGMPGGQPPSNSCDADLQEYCKENFSLCDDTTNTCKDYQPGVGNRGLSPTSSAEEEEPNQGVEFVYYNQTDPQWADAKFTCTDKSEVSFAGAGCNPTTTAMMMSTFVASSYTPDKIKEDYFNDPKMCKGSGVSIGFDVLEANGFEIDRSADISDIDAQLAQGNLYQASVSFVVDGEKITHYTIITGKNSKGEYIFQDPYFGPNVVLSDKIPYTLIGYALIIPPKNSNPTQENQNATTIDEGGI